MLQFYRNGMFIEDIIAMIILIEEKFDTKIYGDLRKRLDNL